MAEYLAQRPAFSFADFLQLAAIVAVDNAIEFVI